MIAIGFCMNVSLYYTNLDQSRNSDSILYKKYELENKFKELEKKVKQMGEKVSNNITQTFENKEKLNNESSDEKLKELSLILKDKLQQLGRLSCEIAKDSTSVNGGWCAKISGVGGGQHMTDEKLVLFLSKFLKGI
jgi:mevalonate kinase